MIAFDHTDQTIVPRRVCKCLVQLGTCGFIWPLGPTRLNTLTAETSLYNPGCVSFPMVYQRILRDDIFADSIPAMTLDPPRWSSDRSHKATEILYRSCPWQSTGFIHFYQGVGSGEQPRARPRGLFSGCERTEEIQQCNLGVSWNVQDAWGGPTVVRQAR